MFSYNFASPDAAILKISRVRLHIPDREAPYSFDDSELQVFLDDNGGNAKLAAADALESKATDEAFVQKVQTTLGVSTNGAATADFVIKRAERLRAQATIAMDNDGGNDAGWVSTAPYTN